MKAFLDHFAAILGALTIALLMMSISHEYGYFTLVGRHFQTLLTTTDYLANAVLWLPLALLYVWATEWHRLNYKKPEQKPDWRNWRTWRKPVGLVAFIAFLLMTSTWPPGPGSIMAFMMVTVIIWSRLWSFFYRPIEGLGDELNATYQKVIKVGPPLVALLFLWGWIGASMDLEQTYDPYVVKFKNRENSELRILLRTFDRGLLMRDAVSNRIEFNKWEDVVALEKRSQLVRETFVCYLSGYLCRRDIPPTP